MGDFACDDCGSVMLKVRDLGYRVEGKSVFSHLNFEILQGEKKLLKGKNGSGKSSLLAILQGYLKPSCGVVERDEGLRIGYLFQESNDQFIAPSVLEDVAFSLLARGESEAEKKAKEILERLEISHLAQSSIFSLSGGEKRLVAIAGVLVCECDLYLLDEPFNEIDYRRCEIVEKMILEKEGGVLLASHQMINWENQLVL